VTRTGKYKLLVVLATLASSSAYLLLMLRWHGNTGLLESMYIVPGGFGTGIAQSALFISLQAVVDKAHIAPAVGVMYLITSVGFIFGLACMSATLQGVLRTGLEDRLLRLGLDVATRGKVRRDQLNPSERGQLTDRYGRQIIASAVEDIEYVHKAEGVVRCAIVAAYVDSLWWSHGKWHNVCQLTRS
jgi:hypothetical protein